jgi:histidine ammonia-lyase
MTLDAGRAALAAENLESLAELVLNPADLAAPATPGADPDELLPLLRASEEQFRAVVANVPGAVFRCACDDEWQIRFMSEHIERICGFPPSDFIDNAVRSYGSVIHPEDRPYVIREIDQALEDGSPYSLQYRLVHANGEERWVSERASVILGEHGERLWLDGVILDVTDQVLVEQDRDRAEAELRRQSELNRHQALHDSLTGLPNRVLFQDRVRQAILSAQRDGGLLAVLVMDLDRFKEINDTLGHGYGDRFLVEAAKRLETTLRGVDSIARLGGDEFAMLLESTGTEQVKGATARIRSAFHEPFELQGLPLQIEASIGVAMYPSDAYDVEGLIQRADVAMYVAKHESSGWAAYDPEHDRNEPARLSLIGELRRAIDERELVLHYQPKVELRGGRVTGVEALVRWCHPTRGLLGPDTFIDAAQETSLIRPFTLYVIDEALHQCHLWADEGQTLTVAVNVSTRNLIDVDFPDQVQALLQKWDVPPDRLELEITESAIVADMFRVKTVLDRLGAMGLQLSVDDFGTGYTSLGYLRRLPITELKIDRSFVANMTSSEEDAVIVRSAIDLGRNLGLSVVAEGVEDTAVLARLEQLGCDVAQGYLMSRPVPPDELTAWLAQLPSPAKQPRWQTEPASPALVPVVTGSVVPVGTGPLSPVVIGAGRLSIGDVVRVAADEAEVVLDPAADPRIRAARSVIDRILESGETVYGVTTGVGAQKRVGVAADDQERFNRQMILAHCVGHGDPAPRAFVRAAMAVRAHGLALGAAGVRPVVVQSLLLALNAGAIPTVHLIGSIGQSDLSPMAEIARALIGAGPQADLMAGAGVPALRLAPREALALISSNAFAVGIAALALHRATIALRVLELSAALSFEGFVANVAAVDPAVGVLRPHPGIAATIMNLRALLDGGTLLSGATAARNLQDPLCFRNVPQTHAAVRHSLDHAIELIETELGSAGDNPAILADEGRALSNGNHDTTPIALGLDYARLGLAQAVTVANERIQKLLDPRFSGLPSGLRASDDLAEDGLAAVGHGSTALAAECRLLAGPVTLEHATSSVAEGIEDRVTLAPLAARRLHEMSGYAIRLAAIELVSAAQAVDLRSRDRDLGGEIARAYAGVREHIPFTGAGHAPVDSLDPLARWLEATAGSGAAAART